MMNSPITKKRSINLEGIKALIATGALAVTISLWSIFSNQDRASALNKVEVSTAVNQPTAELSLLLPPLPTLVPFQVGNDVSQGAAVVTVPSAQDLRSVSAPVVSVPNNSNPMIVQGSRGTTSSAPAPVTRTRSS